eukprot:268712_1
MDVTTYFKNTEILFDLFPSIFMPYLDVYTFCELLKTDLWNWHHLLSDRIVFDYCHYISLRTEAQIAEFCNDCQTYEPAHDDTQPEHEHCDNDLMELYEADNRKCIQDEEQNFAVLRLITDRITEINDCFIFSNFKHLDIIRDRMWLTPFKDIGLSTNLCKNIHIVNDNKENNHNKKLSINDPNNTVFVYRTFDELSHDLSAKQIYTADRLMHIKHLLLTDILGLCVHQWYFVQWHQQSSTLNEVKQMIVGHFNPKHSGHATETWMKQELFVAWGIGWQYTEEIK